MYKFLVSIALVASTLTAAWPQDPVTKPKATEAAAARIPIEWSGDTIHAIEVADLAASVKWYQDVLGSKVELDLTAIGWCEVTTPVKGLLVGLGQLEPGAAPKSKEGAQLSLGVKNIEKAAEWLRSKGVKTAEIVEIPETVKLLEFKDPDGNRLMLHQSLGK